MRPLGVRWGLLPSVSLLLSIAGTGSQALPCALGVTNRTISSSVQAANLAEALLCYGGQFEVAWVGDVLLPGTIHVSNGTFLKVSGSSPGGSVVDGGAQHQLFNVSGGSVLELKDLSLVNGASSSGGAVGLSVSSSVEIVDCSFHGNAATSGNGGTFVVHVEMSTLRSIPIMAARIFPILQPPNRAACMYDMACLHVVPGLHMQKMATGMVV